jgi:hypothetical protein
MAQTLHISIRLFIATVLTIFSQLGIAHADDPSLLSKFQGEWASNGDAFGKPAKSTMVWSSTLNSKFIHLDYKISMGTPDKPSIFQGVAYYKSNNDGTYTAFWADNTGDLHPITATVDGNALTSIWGVEGAKLGRTRYELLDQDRLSITDWIKIGDDWRQFNMNVFTHVAPDSSAPNEAD